MQFQSEADFYRVKEAKKQDTAKRRKLKYLYSGAEQFIRGLSKSVLSELEYSCPLYERRFENIRDLQENECVLLVAGDVGSGKSTLVNLLIGKELMPVGDCRCTAALVEVSHGHLPHVTAHYLPERSGQTAEPRIVMFDPDIGVDAFLDKFHRLVMARDDQTEQSPFSKVHIQWPLERLRAGLTIVDSPGAENCAEVVKKISEYSERAVGVIYVINSSPAEEIHKLGRLIYKTMDVVSGFDHSLAMFVCNHWDQVSPGDAEDVKLSLIKKLGIFLPEARNIHLYTLSAKQSAIDTRHGYYRPDFQHLISGIQAFLPQAMNGKLRLYNRYLSGLLKSIQSFIRVKVKDYASEKKDLEDKTTRVINRITTFQRSSKKVLEQLKLSLRSARSDRWSLVGYLKSQHQSALRGWTDAECPKKEKNVHKAANTVIAQRVAQAVDSFVKMVEEDIIHKLKEEFDLFDDDRLKDVKEMLGCGSVSEVQLKSEKNRKTSAHSNISLGAAISSSFKFDHKLDPFFQTKFNHSPTQAMKEATELYIKLMASADQHSVLNSMFDQLLKNIDALMKKIPGMIEADQNLLVTLNHGLDRCKHKMLQLNWLESRCSQIQAGVDMFYVEHLIVPDFCGTQIQYHDFIGAGGFAKVYRGTMKLDDQEVLVALKESHENLTHQDVTDMLNEETTLRRLKHNNIIKYYGMLKTGSFESLKLILVMEYCPLTLKKKCLEIEESPSSLGSNPVQQKASILNLMGYLQQICSGLHYLHRKCIVHRDLKPDNILLTTNNEIRIADLGLARKVKDIVISSTGTLVYIAPEVFQLNDRHDTKIDIYSLSMIMWEMWYGTDLTQYIVKEVPGEVKNSIKSGWRPSLTIVHSPPLAWMELMRKCWDQNPANRPTVSKINDCLMLYYHELQG